MKIKKSRLMRIFSSKGDKTPSTAETPSQNAKTYVEGRLYRIWSWILPLLAGLVFGWFGVVCLGAWLDGNIRQQRPAVSTPVASKTDAVVDPMNMSVFLATNPFRVTPMPLPDPESVDRGGDTPVAITGDLATAILRWPMAGIGAMIESQGKQHIILINQSFDVYTLESVNYLRAVFRKGDERVTKDFVLNPAAVAPPPVPRTASNAMDSNTAASQVSAAEPGGKEGVISATLVQQLMENPFDELKNVRLRPKDGEQGLQIQWINKDSILSQLGVQKGDVIRSINGIPFRNMADITNSMNSLMNSDRFDVEVTRDGKPSSLKYVVR